MKDKLDKLEHFSKMYINVDGAMQQCYPTTDKHHYFFLKKFNIVGNFLKVICYQNIYRRQSLGLLIENMLRNLLA